MATENRHITRIETTFNDFYSNGDHGQSCVTTDNNDWVYYDDGGTQLYAAARQYYYDGAYTYLDNEMGKLTLYDDLEVDEYIYRRGVSDDYIRFQNDSIQVYAGGVRAFDIQDDIVIVNEGAVDFDFRVESDNNTHMIFVDGGNDVVGINNSSPSGTYELDVTGSVNVSTSILTGQLQVDDTSTYIDKDGSNNMTLTDAVTGTKTLAELVGGGVTIGEAVTSGNADRVLFQDASNNLAQSADLKFDSTKPTFSVGKSTIESWDTSYASTQIGGMGALFAEKTESASNGIVIASNYYISSGSPNRVVDDEATALQLKNGSFLFYSKEAATADTPFTPTLRMTLSSSDHATAQSTLSIGKSTIESWGSSYSILQIGGNSALLAETTESANQQLSILQNAYYDGAWKAVSTDEATQYLQGQGKHTFNVAVSTTFDTEITWIEALEIATDEIVFNEHANANYNFRMEGASNTHLFFLDGSENSIGIGTASPSSNYVLDISGATRITSTNTSLSQLMLQMDNDSTYPAELMFHKNSASDADDDDIGKIRFTLNTADYDYSQIISSVANLSQAYGRLTFNNRSYTSQLACLTLERGNLLGIGSGSSILSTHSADVAMFIGGMGYINADNNVVASNAIRITNNAYISSSGIWYYITNDEASIYLQRNGEHEWYSAHATTGAITPKERMKLSSSNHSTTQSTLSIGNTTIHSWDTSYSAIQIGGNANLIGQTTAGAANALNISQNLYYDGAWKHISTNEGTRYLQSDGGHWFYATSTTSGTATEVLGLRIQDDATVINYGEVSGHDFRVASDNNSYMLYVDASVDCVGINQGTPDTNYVLDVSGDVNIVGSVDTNNKNIYAGEVTINDENATSFTPGKEHGALLIVCQDTGIMAMFGYDVSTSSQSCALGFSSSGLTATATTGTLSGTTGADGHLTVAANDSDGKIYIENQTGST